MDNDFLWGAAEIGVFLNIPRQRAYYLLERRLIPARKIGAAWQTTKSELRRHLTGETTPVASDRTALHGAAAAIKATRADAVA